MKRSALKADSRGAGAGDNATAASVQTAPEQGMVDDKNLENKGNHDQRIVVGSKCEHCKRTRKVGSATEHLAVRHPNIVACPGVRPKIRKFTRISLNKAKERKKGSRNHRTRKGKTNLRSIDCYGVQSHTEEKMQMAGQASLEDSFFRQRMERMGSTFEHGGGSSSRHQDLANSGEPKQTQINTLCNEESQETASKLGKAWAKWFHSNGIPGIKADCHGANTTVRRRCACSYWCRDRWHLS